MPVSAFMDRSRPRFNAKARQSVTGSHKRKGRQSKQPNIAEEQSNPNAEIVVSKTEEEREVDRKEKLKQEVSGSSFAFWLLADGSPCGQLLAQSTSKASSKKKKRLDKYIVSKPRDSRMCTGCSNGCLAS